MQRAEAAGNGNEHLRGLLHQTHTAIVQAAERLDRLVVGRREVPDGQTGECPQALLNLVDVRHVTGDDVGPDGVDDDQHLREGCTRQEPVGAEHGHRPTDDHEEFVSRLPEHVADVHRSHRAVDGDRVAGDATTLGQWLPRRPLLPLPEHDAGDASRLTERALRRHADLLPCDVAHHQPQRSPDGRRRAGHAAEASGLTREAEPMPDRTVHEHERDDRASGGVERVQLEVGRGHGAQRSDEQHERLRRCARHHRVDGELLHRAAGTRWWELVDDDGGWIGAGDVEEAGHPFLRRGHERQPISPPGGRRELLELDRVRGDVPTGAGEHGHTRAPSVERRAGKASRAMERTSTSGRVCNGKGSTTVRRPARP